MHQPKALKYLKLLLTDLKGEMNSTTEQQEPLTPHLHQQRDHTESQQGKISLKGHMRPLALVGIYRTFHP